MSPIVKSEKLSKQYKLGLTHAKSIRDLVNQAISSLTRYGLDKQITQVSKSSKISPVEERDFWALKDVSFEINQGEVVGIIGKNGSGKSTLLKILSQITKPTSGQAVLKGRAASLLEVGTGFHPELTGRENVYLNGTILGMSRREIDKKFNEIIDFSGVGKFIDTPVKRYSSGMVVRLGFSVAAHLEPEILIVDEVLAVGDIEFQEKCMGKMRDVASDGRTVLFVSHNMQAIAQLTHRCIVLSSGKVVFDGKTDEAIAEYRRLNQSANIALPEYNNQEKSNAVRSVSVTTSDSDSRHRFGEPLSFSFEISLEHTVPGFCFSFQIVDVSCRPISHYWLFDNEIPLQSEEGVFRLECKIPNPRMFMGHFTLSTYLSDNRSGEMLERLEGICPFEVTMDGRNRNQYQWRSGDAIYLDDFEWKWQHHSGQETELDVRFAPSDNFDGRS